MARPARCERLHHNPVAKIYRLFRSIMTTAVDDGPIARNLVRIKARRPSE
ncbi:MAG: hypothetical protein R2705_23710 [Ilumatobacteraceae bacterium]